MSVSVLSKYNSILKDLQNGKIKPVYLLQGEETFLIDKITETLEHKILTEEQKSFNLNVFYGKEANAGAVIGTCRRYPMMSERQVVMIKEAQEMLKLDELESYLLNPIPSTVFVVSYRGKKLDKRLKISKLFDKYEVFTADKLNERTIPEWIQSFLSEIDLKIDAKAQNLLIAALGSDMSKIANELEKLYILIKGKNIKTINEKIIEEYIGVDRDYNIFELQNALGSQNYSKAIGIVDYFSKNKRSANNSIIPTISQLYGFFNKLYVVHQMPGANSSDLASAMGLNPYFVSDYVNFSKSFSVQRIDKVMRILNEYDMKSKGFNSNLTNEDLYREFIVKIFVAK